MINTGELSMEELLHAAVFVGIVLIVIILIALAFTKGETFMDKLGSIWRVLT